MTYKESIPLAKQLAENALERGFDVEAFLVLSAIEQLPQQVDLIPESNIDEGINNLSELFIQYYNNKNVITIQPLLSTLRQILSELYNTCETTGEQLCVQEFIVSMQSIK